MGGRLESDGGDVIDRIFPAERHFAHLLQHQLIVVLAGGNGSAEEREQRDSTKAVQHSTK